MKKLLFVFSVLFAFSASAQSTNAPPAKVGDDLQAELTARARQTPAELQQVKPNEIRVGKLTYSGILIEGAKTRAPLQLLNPAAPARYGSPEDNLARDSITGRIRGLKFFSLSF
jgi:hypothetical protein